MKTTSFWTVIGFAWRYWRRLPWLGGALIACLLFTTGAQVAMPVMAGSLIDAVTADVTKGAGNVLPAVVMFVGLLVLLDGSRNLTERFLTLFATRCMSAVLKDGFRRVQRFSTDWHSNTFAGATVRKLTRGMWAFDQFEDTLYFGLVPAVLVVGGIMVVLSLSWPVMGLFIGVSVAAYVALLYWLTTNYVAPANADYVEADSRIGGALADAVTCNATVKAFGAEEREDRIIGRVMDQWRRKGVRVWMRHADVFAVQSAILIAMQAGLLVLVYWFWTRGLATPGQVTQVIVTHFVMNNYLHELGRQIRMLQKSVNEVEDLIAFARESSSVEDADGSRPFHAGRGHIVFDRVSFAYARQQSPVYRDFSLTIHPSERVALVGKSGSGKSTFVKLVQRLYDVDTGRILIDGQDIAAVTQGSLRRALALVPQEPLLFHRTLAENIAYGRPGATFDKVEWAARKARAHGFISKLSDGYETLVGERGVKLSGGERQRVAIARAFLADAPILILDEATSSLDSITEAQIQAAMEDLMKGRTTILIAHRLSTVRKVDRILVFSGGRVVEQGTHADLLVRDGGHYRALHMQMDAGNDRVGELASA